MLKSICILPVPHPPFDISAAIAASDCASFGALVMSWYQGAVDGNKPAPGVPPPPEPPPPSPLELPLDPHAPSMETRQSAQSFLIRRSYAMRANARQSDTPTKGAKSASDEVTARRGRRRSLLAVERVGDAAQAHRDVAQRARRRRWHLRHDVV